MRVQKNQNTAAEAMHGDLRHGSDKRAQLVTKLCKTSSKEAGVRSLRIYPEGIKITEAQGCARSAFLGWLR